jgi:thiamine-monophosphate kinase
MALGEFDLIAKYFTRAAPQAVLGVGDDCALLQPAAGLQWAVSCDMLVEGRHFLSTVPADRLGHKALAVNLSDLAACGARPVAFTLALAMPRIDEPWLAGLAEGLFALADAHGIGLVGGDTTAGPLALCITVFGDLPPGLALRRDGARAGDQLWVSHPPGGGLGDARLALEVFRGRASLDAAAFERVRRAMELPQPRVALGLALRSVATAAIDLSDGLLGDLGHVLARSGVGATVQVDSLPVSDDLAQQPRDCQRAWVLAGGDDYELLFTAPPAAQAAVRAAAHQAGVGVRLIGQIDAAPGLRLLAHDGQAVEPTWRAFDHFAA